MSPYLLLIAMTTIFDDIKNNIELQNKLMGHQRYPQVGSAHNDSNRHIHFCTLGHIREWDLHACSGTQLTN